MNPDPRIPRPRAAPRPPALPPPPVPEDLLRHLEGLYPEVAPLDGQSDRSVWIAHGRRSVVLALRRMLEQERGE